MLRTADRAIEFRTFPKSETLRIKAPSAPLPEFVTRCGTLDTNFGVERALASL